jgi:twitching motility protein PilT
MIPIARIDGDLVPIAGEKVLNQETILRELKIWVPPKLWAWFSDHFEIDLAIEFPELARCRVNIFRQATGVAAAFRIIPFEVTSLEKLGMPGTVKKLCELPHGLILVTGPTGSGKSTTLSAMIDYINQTEPCHILTLEDPIEFIHPSKKSLVQQREIHQHSENYGDALRAALREDPDVILVGEMRDLETIRLALTAAETGHLVLATLHTSSAAKTINRIVDVFPAGEKDLMRTMLSESLQAVIAQTLLKRRGGGRVAALEILICNTAVRNLIRENKVPQIESVIQTGQAQGMKTLEASIKELTEAGLLLF